MRLSTVYWRVFAGIPRICVVRMIFRSPERHPKLEAPDPLVGPNNHRTIRLVVLPYQRHYFRETNKCQRVPEPRLQSTVVHWTITRMVTYRVHGSLVEVASRKAVRTRWMSNQQSTSAKSEAQTMVASAQARCQLTQSHWTTSRGGARCVVSDLPRQLNTATC